MGFYLSQDFTTPETGIDLQEERGFWLVGSVGEHEAKAWDTRIILS